MKIVDRKCLLVVLSLCMTPLLYGAAGTKSSEKLNNELANMGRLNKEMAESINRLKNALPSPPETATMTTKPVFRATTKTSPVPE